MRTLIRSIAVGIALAVAGGVGTLAMAGTVANKTQGPASEPTDCPPGTTAFACPCLAPDATADAASGRLGVELLAAVSGEGRTNALVSPLGIGAVLAMLSQGAVEPVRRAIGEMLGGWGGVPPHTLPCRLAALLGAAREDPRVKLNIANAAFAERRLDLFPSFAAVLGDRFGARVERLDFADAGSVSRINAWVARETANAIPSLVSSLDPDDVLVLANAMHFHGEWTRQFDPALTVPRPFHLHAGPPIDVATMQMEELSARYREDAHFQAVSLPYGSGGFALVVVLPREGGESAAALRGLASDPSWFGGEGFYRMHGYLALPKVTLDGDASLLPVLRALGLGSALDDADAFAGIATPAPALSRVVHRTMLELDEQGTEAAAATAAIMTTRAAMPPDEGFEMQVDRPFAMAVRHRGTGGLLFTAWVADPTGGR